jgi:hypothetical protein
MIKVHIKISLYALINLNSNKQRFIIFRKFVNYLQGL